MPVEGWLTLKVTDFSFVAVQLLIDAVAVTV